MWGNATHHNLEKAKRFVARAVELHDNNVGFHIYDYPDVNGLPESRVTKLAQEFGLENSKNFIWYGKDHFERIQAELDRIDRRDRYTPRNGINGRPNMTSRAVITDAVNEPQSPFEHHIPFARISHLLGDHFRGVNPLEDDVLKQIIKHTQDHVEKRGKEVAHQEQSMSIGEQRYLLSILRSVLPALVPAEDK